jgi:alanyl aminopeptidase
MTRFAIALSTFVFTAFAADPPALRLPQTVEPLRCSIDLTLDPAKPDLTGEIAISLRVKEPVALFWLNGTDIEIKSASVEAGGRARAARILPGGEDFIGLQFDEPLPAGPARLTASYTAKVNAKSSAGVFSNKVGEDRYLFTQFEPFDARRAFPCFDEPAYKVPWQLTIRAPKGNEAFANTSVVSDKTEGNQRVVRFAETKPLPSYLIAFAVGPLETVDAGRAGRNKFPVRIIVPRGARDQAKYAASVTAEILTRLEDYFGIPYPYDKSDSLAIPSPSAARWKTPGL